MGGSEDLHLYRRRLLIVEDDVLMASLLARVLEEEGFEPSIAGDVKSARRLVNDVDPDCVLIDLSLGPGPSGADLATVLHHQRPDIALILLTRYPDLRSAGLGDYEVPPNCGFLRKDKVSDPKFLVLAIEQVLRDKSMEVRDDTDPDRPLGNLTEQQQDILRLMALGYTNEAIAQMKGASSSSVERWVAGILQAMGIDGRGRLNPRVEAVRRYVAVVGVPERE